MTFPVTEATNVGATSGFSGDVSFDVPLPSDVTAGRLLIITGVAGSSDARTVSTPSGWTALYNVVGGGGGGTEIARFWGFWKEAEGDEGSTVTVTASSTVNWTTNSYSISGWGSIEAATPATGNSANPNPPSFSPSWGSDDTLWIAVEGDAEATAGAPTYPTNYTDGIFAQHVIISTVTALHTASARRENATGTEDPGTFTLASAEEWVATTIAIQPAPEAIPVFAAEVAVETQNIGVFSGVTDFVTPAEVAVETQNVGVFSGVTDFVTPAEVAVEFQTVGVLSDDLVSVTPLEVAVEPQSVNLAINVDIPVGALDVAVEPQFASVLAADVSSVTAFEVAVEPQQIGLLEHDLTTVDVAEIAVEAQPVGVLAQDRLTVAALSVAVEPQPVNVPAQEITAVATAEAAVEPQPISVLEHDRTNVDPLEVAVELQAVGLLTGAAVFVDVAEVAVALQSVGTLAADVTTVGAVEAAVETQTVAVLAADVTDVSVAEVAVESQPISVLEHDRTAVDATEVAVEPQTVDALAADVTRVTPLDVAVEPQPIRVIAADRTAVQSVDVAIESQNARVLVHDITILGAAEVAVETQSIVIRAGFKVFPAEVAIEPQSIFFFSGVVEPVKVAVQTGCVRVLEIVERDLNLVRPIRNALYPDELVTGLIGTYLGGPSIHTRRPVPVQAMYPMVVISPAISVTDEDGIKSDRPVVVYDIIVYGQKDTSYRDIETLAFILRRKFHREREVIRVPGYHVIDIEVSGPIPGPTDDQEYVARVVSLQVRLVEKPEVTIWADC